MIERSLKTPLFGVIPAALSGWRRTSELTSPKRSSGYRWGIDHASPSEYRAARRIEYGLFRVLAQSANLLVAFSQFLPSE